MPKRKLSPEAQALKKLVLKEYDRIERLAWEEYARIERLAREERERKLKEIEDAEMEGESER